ncbi:IucA/IucC family siderophore biosynthesis protein [Streptomyces sp. PTM05]|uniref:IucA/IucC family siderophore biosynthesis protein n=1 Tax=Streptantibioticus parmotrematis TaxID=2873249 RepID=A0ABS7QLP7_9ACTN|nr:IucA/IucC family protein [Streptantibioticus parmotrematis]MBY8884096.1 IucA/IucC family siderophore biosynthesis protein [Streptantibioticus parmotrematis]
MSGPDPAADPEPSLLTRVLDALLREDVGGLRTRSAEVTRADGRWLVVPGPDGGGDALALPVTRDGFQCEDRARLPLLRREPTTYGAEPTTCGAEPTGARPAHCEDLTTCDAVLAALRERADAPDRAGFDAYAAECRQTLETMRLHDSVRDDTHHRLALAHGDDPAHWRGPLGALALDALAAFHDHPVYPTARGRAGLGECQLRAFAPEFLPAFRPRWVALPKDAVVAHGVTAHRVWPTPARLGLPELDRTHVALPVHPLTRAQELHEALREAGLADHAVLARRPHLDLRPTLSMRTGAVACDPYTHLKLPLATSTLGLLNRRTIKPGTLVDGAVCQRLLEAVIAREPRFEGVVLLADETAYAHAGHPLLAVLLRTLPAGLDDAAVVPLAALLAPAPGGRQVIDHLAGHWFGGDPLALLDAVLRPLFDWQTTLYGYGIALESHQQNVSVVLDRDDAGAVRVRLLLKDNDGPRVHTERLAATLGGPPPAFDDPRVLGADDDALAALFTTITVHLCAGAYAFGLARAGRVPLDAALAVVRDRLAEAIGRMPQKAGRALRARTLDAARLPVKAMVTAGTLRTKERSGAADINKHYTTGPNYLVRSARS